MYRIRFHGRGGQGIKTASRILGSTFFLQGYEVQDAPRYGAERRGAPIFAYVRAARNPINERGIIQHPDLVIVADDSLIGIPVADVLQGVGQDTVLLLNTHDDEITWRQRLNINSVVLALPATEENRAELPYVGSRCAAAAAALTGVIPRETITGAIQEELDDLGSEVVRKNIDNGLAAFDAMQAHRGIVKESGFISASGYAKPDWIDVPFEDASISAPAIHAPSTSVEVRTGLWRTARPVIDYEKCRGCWWVCSTLCPDGDIRVVQEKPQIDYDHCKGCLVCAGVCPSHAITVVPEHAARPQVKEPPS